MTQLLFQSRPDDPKKRTSPLYWWIQITCSKEYYTQHNAGHLVLDRSITQFITGIFLAVLKPEIVPKQEDRPKVLRIRCLPTSIGMPVRRFQAREGRHKHDAEILIISPLGTLLCTWEEERASMIEKTGEERLSAFQYLDPNAFLQLSKLCLQACYGCCAEKRTLHIQFEEANNFPGGKMQDTLSSPDSSLFFIISNLSRSHLTTSPATATAPCTQRRANKSKACWTLPILRVKNTDIQQEELCMQYRRETPSGTLKQAEVWIYWSPRSKNGITKNPSGLVEWDNPTRNWPPKRSGHFLCQIWRQPWSEGHVWTWHAENETPRRIQTAAQAIVYPYSTVGTHHIP